MGDPHNLRRFIDAQDGVYEIALGELVAGRKQSHWMWFIFPQLRGLGISPTAQFYGITSLAEGRGYLEHPVLGMRLRECIEALLPWNGRRSADQILGPIDALKLRSSFTFFDQMEPGGLFASGLAIFFGGDPDQRTLALLNGQR